MSFEDYDDCFLWRCDDCGKQTAFKPHDFYDCVQELKDRGWGFAREDDGWRHMCGRCNYKHRQTNMMDRTFSRPREVK